MENQNMIAIMAHAVETEYRQADKAAGRGEESTPVDAPAQAGFSWRKIWRHFTTEKGAASVGDPQQAAQ